ncbi:MAG: hypothetical protein ACT4QA_07065 [Panacagrimonas sp.]
MELLDKAREKLKSDSAVARYLKVTPPTVAQWRSGVRPISAYQAAKLATLLNENPLEAAISSMEKTAKSLEESKNWREWRKYLVTVSAVVLMTVESLHGVYPPLFLHYVQQKTAIVGHFIFDRFEAG